MKCVECQKDLLDDKVWKIGDGEFYAHKKCLKVPKGRGFIYEPPIWENGKKIEPGVWRRIRKNPEVREIEIPKGKGRVRKIVVPSNDLKTKLRNVLSDLNERPFPDSVQGFTIGRSPVTNALKHVGYDVTISIDLEDFFDTVTAAQLKGKVPKDLIELSLLCLKCKEGINIREANFDDAKDIQILNNEFLESQHTTGYFEKNINDIIIALDNNELAGYIMSSEGIIKNIVVRPSSRRKRIGWSLIDEVKNEAIGHDEKLITRVREGDTQAKKFFKKMGFEKKEVIESYYKNGENAILFEWNPPQSRDVQKCTICGKKGVGFYQSSPICLHNGYAAQGLPTSPILANIAATKMDKSIMKGLKKKRYDFVYTRYADDISISLNNATKKKIREVIEIAERMIKHNRFKVNSRKTKIQYASSGKREICGVLSGKDNIRPMKRHRNKLRGLSHSLKEEEKLYKKWKGMSEWCALKIPLSLEEKAKRRKEIDESEKVIKEANSMLKHYRIGKIKKTTIEKSFEEVSIGDFAITSDPRYMVGMSELGNSWTSCMSLSSSYKYKRGLAFWVELKGASIAVIWGSKERKIAGVRLKEIAARALIYKTTSGNKCFGKIYPGGTKVSNELREKLEELGFVPSGECKGERVEGSVRTSISLPYFDNSSQSKSDNVRIVTIKS